MRVKLGNDDIKDIELWDNLTYCWGDMLLNDVIDVLNFRTLELKDTLDNMETTLKTTLKILDTLIEIVSK